MIFLVATLAAALLLFALNGRLRARRVRQWQFGVLASEFGVFLAPVALALAAWSAGFGAGGIPGAVMALAAFATLLCPEIGSLKMCRTLDGKLTAAFGEASRPALPGTPPEAVRRLLYAAPGGCERGIVFHPAAPGRPAPCVVVVHSGGWESGSPEEFPGFHRALAKSGYAVACVEYGLTPAHAWPTPRDDVRAAIVRLKANAADLGIDPGNLVLFGRSAGGQIALCAAYDRPDPAVRGVAAFYAPTDMVFSWRGSYDGDILDSPRLLKNYLGGRPHETPETHAEASPVRHVRAGAVPTLLLHGARDELVWCLQSRRLARELKRAGAPHLALIAPWGRHALDYRLSGPGGRLAFRAMLGFLDRVTGR